MNPGDLFVLEGLARVDPDGDGSVAEGKHAAIFTQGAPNA
jgi:hypothetical protein